MSQEEIFHFTVGQLVEILKSLTQDLPVLTSGYESGFENLNETIKKDTILQFPVIFLQSHLH